VDSVLPIVATGVSNRTPIGFYTGTDNGFQIIIQMDDYDFLMITYTVEISRFVLN